MKVEFKATDLISFLSRIERDSIWTADYDNIETEQGMLYKWAYQNKMIETRMEDDECSGYREEYADLTDRGHKFLNFLREGKKFIQDFMLVERVFDRVDFTLFGETLAESI
jgi:hypothetical protein